MTAILDDISLLFIDIWPFYMGIVFFIMAITGFWPFMVNERMKPVEVFGVFIRRMAFFALFAGLAWYAIVYFYFSRVQPDEASIFWQDWFAKWRFPLISISITGLLLKILISRYLAPELSEFFRKKRVNQKTERLSDIRQDVKEAVKSKSYLPENHYKSGVFFTGMAEKNGKSVPIYIADKTWREANKLSVGPTRFGKGVIYQIMLQQHIRRSDCVFFIDPKGDNFIPKIMAEEARKLGRRFIEIDLSDDDKKGSWSPFLGGAKKDRFARFTTAMSLIERGTDADHYKALSRGVFNKIFQDLGDETSIQNILRAAQQLKSDHEASKAIITVVSRLEEWASRKTFTPHAKKQVFEIERALLSDAIVYVKGSQDDTVSKLATQTFLIELLQETKRLMPERQSHVAICVDELSFLITEAVTNALATIVGFNASLFVAFQSFGDLLNPDDRTIDGRAMEQKVKVNCQIKFIFGGSDTETAKYVSELSGNITKEVTHSEFLTVNETGGELWEGNRTVTTVEEALITANKVLSLPRQTAALYQPGHLAEIVSLSHVPVKALDG